MSGLTRGRLTKDSTLEEVVELAAADPEAPTVIMFDDAVVIVYAGALADEIKQSVKVETEDAGNDLGGTDIHKPEQTEEEPEHSSDGESSFEHPIFGTITSSSRQSDESDE